MELPPDELAGIVDLFGGLTREEIHRAIDDLSAKQGHPTTDSEIDSEIDDALTKYYLVEVDHSGETIIAAGPSSLPTLPRYGDDLPHILSVTNRTIPPESLGYAAEKQLRADAAQAINSEDVARMEELIDICYEVESWAPVETIDIREELATHTGD